MELRSAAKQRNIGKKRWGVARCASFATAFHPWLLSGFRVIRVFRGLQGCCQLFPK
jgi:hypothetical protein